MIFVIIYASDSLKLVHALYIYRDKIIDVVINADRIANPQAEYLPKSQSSD